MLPQGYHDILDAADNQWFVTMSLRKAIREVIKKYNHYWEMYGVASNERDEAHARLINADSVRKLLEASLDKLTRRFRVLGVEKEDLEIETQRLRDAVEALERDRELMLDYEEELEATRNKDCAELARLRSINDSLRAQNEQLANRALAAEKKLATIEVLLKE